MGPSESPGDLSGIWKRRNKQYERLIIFGYPGIGKTSIAGWDNCIDLESSYFSRTDPIWVEHYCKIGLMLAKQGYTVLMSTHQLVVDMYVRRITNEFPSMVSDVDAVIFCPSDNMKDCWAERLLQRYLRSSAAKDLRAFEGAIEFWESKIAYLNSVGLKVYTPESTDYDLRDYILKIRKECCEEETE